MYYYQFTGEVFICNNSGTRIQPTIINLESGSTYKPIVTSKSKHFNKFWNSSLTKKKFYFTGFLCSAFPSWNLHLRNVKVYSDEEFIQNFSEYMI